LSAMTIVLFFTQPRDYNWGATWKKKSSGSSLESLEYVRRNPSRWRRGILYSQKLALTSPTSDGRSVGIVRSRTQATEFSFSFSAGVNFHFFSHSKIFANETLMDMKSYTTQHSCFWSDIFRQELNINPTD
jgi:hypothetical protein